MTKGAVEHGEGTVFGSGRGRDERREQQLNRSVIIELAVGLKTLNPECGAPAAGLLPVQDGLPAQGAQADVQRQQFQLTFTRLVFLDAIEFLSVIQLIRNPRGHLPVPQAEPCGGGDEVVASLLVPIVADQSGRVVSGRVGSFDDTPRADVPETALPEKLLVGGVLNVVAIGQPVITLLFETAAKRVKGRFAALFGSCRHLPTVCGREAAEADAVFASLFSCGGFGDKIENTAVRIGSVCQGSRPADDFHRLHAFFGEVNAMVLTPRLAFNARTVEQRRHAQPGQATDDGTQSASPVGHHVHTGQSGQRLNARRRGNLVESSRLQNLRRLHFGTRRIQGRGLHFRNTQRIDPGLERRPHGILNRLFHVGVLPPCRGCPREDEHQNCCCCAAFHAAKLPSTLPSWFSVNVRLSSEGCGWPQFTPQRSLTKVPSPIDSIDSQASTMTSRALAACTGSWALTKASLLGQSACAQYVVSDARYNREPPLPLALRISSVTASHASSKSAWRSGLTWKTYNTAY